MTKKCIELAIITVSILIIAGLLLLTAHADYRVQGYGRPLLAQTSLKTQNLPIKWHQGEHYSQLTIDNWLQAYAPENFDTLRRLIKCESSNQNIQEMDSNGLMSHGILQFNGVSTWDAFAPLAGISSSPMNPISAIKVANYMINHGELGRWSCSHLLGML